MTRDQVVAIVSDALARFESDFRDPEKALEPFSDDLVWWIAGSATTSGTMDRQGMLAMFRGLPSYTDTGMRLTPTSWVVEGNRAAVEGESWMRLKDGRVYTNLYHWLFELGDDGKICRVREYLDTALVEALTGKA